MVKPEAVTFVKLIPLPAVILFVKSYVKFVLIVKLSLLSVGIVPDVMVAVVMVAVVACNDGMFIF